MPIGGAAAQKRKRKRGLGFLQSGLAFSQLCKFILALQNGISTSKFSMLIFSLVMYPLKFKHVKCFIVEDLSPSFSALFLVWCRLGYIIKLCSGGYTPILEEAESKSR